MNMIRIQYGFLSPKTLKLVGTLLNLSNRQILELFGVLCLCCHFIMVIKSGVTGKLACFSLKQCPICNDHASGPAHLRGGLGPKENVPNFLSNEKQFINLWVLILLF